MPGLAALTGARVLAEIGDDRAWFADARGTLGDQPVGDRAAAPGRGRVAAAAGRGPDRAGRRRLAVAASGRRDQRSTAVLLRPRPGEGNAQMIAGWPYSVVAAWGSGPQQLDRGAGHGPRRPDRRRDRGDRRAAAPDRGSAARGRARVAL